MVYPIGVIKFPGVVRSLLSESTHYLVVIGSDAGSDNSYLSFFPTTSGRNVWTYLRSNLGAIHVTFTGAAFPITEFDQKSDNLSDSISGTRYGIRREINHFDSNTFLWKLPLPELSQDQVVFKNDSIRIIFLTGFEKSDGSLIIRIGICRSA